MTGPDAGIWQARAACRDVHPDLFWPTHPSRQREDIAAAVEVCRRCPVLDECRDYAASLSRPIRAGGIWAGTWYTMNGRPSPIMTVEAARP